jgi:hypothetical protein
MDDHRLPHRSAYRARAGERLPSGRERARQAAEALFAPKRRDAEPAAPAIRPATAQPAPTPPRPPQPPSVDREPRREPATASSGRATAKPEIPPVHLTRIRTWLKYGMTIGEVANVYGVEIGEIERILRKA